MATSRDNRTISEFKSRLLGGGARPNLFEVELTGLPTSVALPWQAERFGFLCKAAQMPAQTIANIDVPLEVVFLKSLVIEQLKTGQSQ